MLVHVKPLKALFKCYRIRLNLHALEWIEMIFSLSSILIHSNMWIDANPFTPTCGLMPIQKMPKF